MPRSDTSRGLRPGYPEVDDTARYGYRLKDGSGWLLHKLYKSKSTLNAQANRYVGWWAFDTRSRSAPKVAAYLKEHYDLVEFKLVEVKPDAPEA